MKIAKQSGFGNTSLIGNITFRMVGTYALVIIIGLLLFNTPLFRWNWFAMIAYLATASILLGTTPTKRPILTNIYGIVFKKPIKQIVSDQSTRNTIGHGIKDVEDDVDLLTPAIKLYSGNYALVYKVTSSINRWSTTEDVEKQVIELKQVFNMLEPGEGLLRVIKNDNDTGMMQLSNELSDLEDINPEDEDLIALSEKRHRLLHTAASSSQARSYQQYIILTVKPKNVNRMVQALEKACRIMSPAPHPIDVLLATMGLEGGIRLDEFKN